MAEFPALPLWTDAYLADTTHLTTIEHGAYLLLLIAMWRAPGQRLPNDDSRLARYAKLTPGQWQRIRSTIMEFFRVEGDWITQGRLTDEAIVVRQNSKKQSDKARSRWRKNKESYDAVAMPDACRNDAPTPTPTPIEDKDTNVSSSIARIPTPDDLTEAVTIWNQMAARNGLSQVQKLTDQRKTKLRARLNDCGGIEGWAVACSKVNGNAFLTGQTGDWKADFDFMLQASRFTKLMEGGYDRNRTQAEGKGATGFAALLTEDFATAQD